MLQKITNTSYYSFISVLNKFNITGNAVMTENKTSQITTEVNSTNVELSPEQTRRNFIKKFGKLAAVTPLGLTSLMTAAKSKPIKSCIGQNGKPKPCKGNTTAF